MWDNRGEKVFEQRYPRFTSFQFRPWTLRCVTEEMRKVGVAFLCQLEREEEPPRDRRAVPQGERAAGVAEAHRRDREEDPVHRPVPAAASGDAPEEGGDGSRAQQAVSAERGDGGRVGEGEWSEE